MREYAKYSKNLTLAHEQLLITHAREGWERAERALKKHEVIQKAKRAGLEVGKWLLALGLLAGTVMVAAAAPNAFAAVVKMSGRTRRYYVSLPQSKFDRRLAQGSSKKYWRYVKTSPSTYKITLTKLGKQIALRAQIRTFKLHPQPAWDGRWRIVMFDIPKKHNAGRDALRRKLVQIGMHLFQESIFVYPYPCSDEVQMWVEFFGLERNVAMAEAQFSKELNDELADLFEIQRAAKI